MSKYQVLLGLYCLIGIHVILSRGIAVWRRFSYIEVLLPITDDTKWISPRLRPLVHHYADKRGGGEFFKFCADVFYGSPFGIIVRCNHTMRIFVVNAFLPIMLHRIRQNHVQFIVGLEAN